MTGDRLYLPYNSSNNDYAKSNRKKPTYAELLMWTTVLSHKPGGYKFTRQKPIDNFIADFYCSKLGLVVEVDGESHNGRQDYDNQRTMVFKEHGIKVVRYTNDEVINNISGVLEDLMKIIEWRKMNLKIFG